MSDALFQIDVTIEPSRSIPGINRVDAGLARLENRQRTVQAANDNLRGTFDRLGNSMGRAANDGGRIGAVFDNIRDRASGASPQIANLTNTLAKFGPMAGVIAGVALAIGAVSTKAIDAAAKVEMWKANLLTITGSAQKAEESYAALVDFATKTPFDLGQAVEGFTKLRTLGLQATEGALMSFGNTAAAMGKPLSQMIEAVADAATGEFERLKEFGIKSKQEGDKVKFTFGGVTTSLGKDAASIQKYLENLGNSKFGGAMARQMDTIKGAMSNVEDAVFQAFAAIGGGQLGSSVKEMLKSVSEGVGAATPMLAGMGNVIGSLVGAVGSVLNSLGSLWLSLHGGASSGTTMLDGLTVGFNLVAQGVEVFGNVLSATFGAMAGMVNGTISLFSDGFSTLFNWMGVSFETSGRSWSNSIVGILRAVKAVVTQMPNLFAIAINDVMRMFRDLGSGIFAFLSGDIKKGMGFFSKEQFANTGKAMNALGRIAVDTYKDVKGADAAMGRLLGRDRTKAKLDAGNVLTPKPDAKKDDKDKEAERRAKQEAEFWKTLQGEVETAKLLPKAAEDHRKELELQKILGRDLIAGEQARIASLMQQARMGKLMTGLQNDHLRAGREIADLEAMVALRRGGASDAQLAVEKVILDRRSAAIDAGATLADLQTDAWKAAEAQLRADQTRLGVLGQQNKSLDEQAAKLKDMARDGSSYAANALRSDSAGVAARRGAAQADYAKQIASLKAALASSDADVRITPEAFQAGVAKAGDEFRETMRTIGTEFANRMDRAANMLGRISDIVGGKAGAFLGQASDLTRGIGNFQSTKDDLADEFKRVFDPSGKSGLVAGIGKAVGSAMAGLQIGEQIGQLGKSLGLKGGETGAKVGGALGGAFGPIGAIAGSVIGAIGGSLFYKAPKGQATITGSGVSLSGNNAQLRSGAKGMAGGVQDGLARLASELGATVGAFNVSIGTYKDMIRVNPTGGAVGGVKGSGAITYASEAEAIAGAISAAIKQGALTGLSDLAQKALNGLGADSAVSLVKDFNAAMKDFTSITDPLAAAVQDVVGGIDALRASMVKVGASTSDLTRLDEYRAKKLDAVLKQQVSGFQSLLDDLNGDAGGVTALNQLTANLSKLDVFKADIAAGKTVDQDAYKTLADKVLGNAGDVYGANTTAYQDIISSLKSVTSGAIINTTTAFNSASGSLTNQTIVDQTNAITAQQGIANDYLRQIAEAVTSGGMVNAYAAEKGFGDVSNGRLVSAF